MSLLRQIQDAAIDSSVDLPTLLRKCKVLAARLGNEDFKHWIDCELVGYDEKDDLPAYRILNVNSKGHFSGAYGSGIRNADIPLSCVPKELRESLKHSYMMQPVAAIVSLVKNQGSGLLQEPWNPDVVALVGHEIYQHMNCMQAWKVIPASSLVAALDSVRTRILNFVLEIESKNPDAGEAMANEKPLPQDIVQHIFNTYITGDVQNLASGSTNVKQIATSNAGIDADLFAKLLDALSASELPKDVQLKATGAIEELRSSRGTSGFKEKYQHFISLLADHMQVLGPVVAPYLPALNAIAG
jgi:AbiTii